MTDADRLQEAKDFAVDIARESFPDLPQFYFRWSNRLTKTAGRIIWYNYDRVDIKLASKIFFTMIREQGIDAACDEIHQTMLHELGHLIVGHPGHGFEWQNTVIDMGGNAEKFHHMTTGIRMVPAELRAKFPVGSTVCFVHKGRKIVGKVVKHNPKNIKIIPPNSSRWWNMPWSIAGSRLAKV